jgi:hypothetical protein
MRRRVFCYKFNDVSDEGPGSISRLKCTFLWMVSKLIPCSSTLKIGAAYLSVKFTPVLKYSSTTRWIYMGSGCIDPCILDLSTSGEWVASFTSRLLYSRGKSSRFPMDRRLGAPQDRSGSRGDENILYLTGTQTGACGRVTGWGTLLQVGRSRVQVPMRSLDFFSLPNPSGRTMALGLTQPLTEMSTRN